MNSTEADLAGEAKQHISSSWAGSQSINPVICEFHPCESGHGLLPRPLIQQMNKPKKKNEINPAPVVIGGLGLAYTKPQIQECTAQ